MCNMVLLKSEQKLKIGDLAPDFELLNVDDNYVSLKNLEGKAFLIIFMCNHCPYVKPKIKTIKDLHQKYSEQKLVIICINSNESENYPEDSFENMQAIAKRENFKFFYLHDKTQETAKLYGAVCTPDPFLFDKDKKLVYHGRIDNALSPEQKATVHDMDEAISSVLKGKKPKHSFLYSMGCSIKWKE